MSKETVTIEKATIWKITTGIFAVLFIVTLINMKLGGSVAAAPTVPSAAQDEFPVVSADMKALVDDDAILGDSDAPVTIVEFSDYECPFCARFHQQTFGTLKQEYIDSGKVRFVYRDFPLSFHAQAQKAAEAAECAGEQGKYWEMSNELFVSGVAGGVASFKQYAVKLGLDATAFNTCLDTGAFAAEVKADMASGGSVGVQGTPGFIIGKTNGKTAQVISGAYPIDAFREVIDAQLN